MKIADTVQALLNQREKVITLTDQAIVSGANFYVGILIAKPSIFNSQVYSMFLSFGNFNSCDHRNRHHPAKSGARRNISDIFIFRQCHAVLSFRRPVPGRIGSYYLCRGNHGFIFICCHNDESGYRR